jgi:ferrous iron transport protein B
MTASEITVALIGNPNTGKSTLFNLLAGGTQQTGNYPGVTVEKKLGRGEFHGQKFLFIDLPGTYSLAPRSPDEMVAVDVLLGRQKGVALPEVVLCIVDASNLERNFYLLSQLLEIGRPVVVALNMIDVAKEKGLTLHLAELQQRLPFALVPLQAHKGEGIDALRQALVDAAGKPPSQVPSPLPPAFQQEVEHLSSHTTAADGQPVPRYLVERLLLDVGGYWNSDWIKAKSPAKTGAGTQESLDALLASARERLKAAGCPAPGVEAASRYQWAASVLKGVVIRPKQRPASLSDRIDRVLTHRLWGTLFFALVMLAMFQAVFWVAEPFNWVIETSTGWLSGLVEAALPEGPLQSLLTEGVINGVGGVLVFLPQICFLFLFIAVLEDCGYMARAAYLMDKLMVRVGLSGKSFIPLVSSFACAVPGIMAARVVENRRDRLITILIAPLMSCSARLPVYSLLTVAFLPDTQYLGGWVGLRAITMFSMYLVGIVFAIVVAWILKKTILRGATPPFVMELPSYKAPGFMVVARRMTQQGWEFIRRAGTLILAVSIIVWALAYFPHNEGVVRPDLLQQRSELSAQLAAGEGKAEMTDDQRTALDAELGHVNDQIAGALLADSYLGRMGKAIEPVVRPLGWDWKLGCAAIASFPAREVVVATLGVIYNLGDDEDEGSSDLQQTLRDAKWDGTDKPVFSVPVALSLMVFFALCAQCVSTLVVIRRETGGWGWPVFTFVYMTVLAYLGAWATYQIGTWLSG